MKKELIKGITAIGLALYTQNTLILGDVHMGYEEAINKSEFLFQEGNILKQLTYWSRHLLNLKI